MPDLGYYRDFQGHPVKYHLPERPDGKWREVKRNELLPTSALNAGCQLVELIPADGENDDPFILCDRWGRIVHQWPDDYVPSLGELFDVCQKVMGA